jgi:hypothetical protein
VRGVPISGMASSTLSLALAALATTTLLTRAMAPLAREARNCLLLWLALHGTRPDQRPDVIKALPPLDQGPLQPARGSRIAKPSDAPASTEDAGGLPGALADALRAIRGAQDDVRRFKRP